jgi:hypothetical protein
MTAFNPSSGHDLGLPGLAPPSGPGTTAAPAGFPLLAAPAQGATGEPECIAGDTPLLALFRQLLEEQARISGSDGQLGEQEMSASLARARDIARRLHDEPVSCAEDLLAKFLAARRVAERTV